MFSEYIGAALRRAKYELLENGTYMATVEGLRGVLATGETIEKCREDLFEAIEEWIVIRLQRGLTIPDLDGQAIGISKRRLTLPEITCEPRISKSLTKRKKADLSVYRGIFGKASLESFQEFEAMHSLVFEMTR
jgi:predicted RNase H-like HicB family nuclease